MPTRLAIAATCLIAFSITANAQVFDPAVIYSGSRHDGSINESAARGVDRFKALTRIEVAEVEPADEGQFEQVDRDQALRGRNPIVVIGASQAAALEKAARQLPNAHFTLIDADLALPNVRSMAFKEHEGAFLMGIVAGLASRTGKVGFVGGMDGKQVLRFRCGYEQGVAHVSKAQVISNMTGTTPVAWRDPARGALLAKAQFDRGADVIFAVAGSTGLGVLQAAADHGKYAIGVDTNQNHLHPGTMLTSLIKRLDSAVYETLAEAAMGRWRAGKTVLGLAENGVDWAVDENNEKLISDAMRTQVTAAKSAIIVGTLTVHDYLDDNACKPPLSRPR